MRYLISYLYTTIYFFTRFFPIIFLSKMQWIDGKEFVEKTWIMKIHVIFGLLLHILTWSRNYIQGTSYILLGNLALMNIGSLYLEKNKYSRNLSKNIHWGVNLLLSIISCIIIWFQSNFLLLSFLVIVDTISLSLILIKK